MSIAKKTGEVVKGANVPAKAVPDIVPKKEKVKEQAVAITPPKDEQENKTSNAIVPVADRAHQDFDDLESPDLHRGRRGRLHKTPSAEEIAALKKPFVMLDGELIEPVATGIRPYRGDRLCYDGFQENNIPYKLCDALNKEFTLYAVNGDRGRLELWLDNDSYAILSSGTEWRFTHVQGGPGVTTLVNSSSVMDTLREYNFLVGVDSKENCLCNSTLTHEAVKDSFVPKLFPQSTRKKRSLLERSLFEKMNVSNSLLSSGNYINSHITSSTIKSDGYCHLKNSRLKSARITADSVTLEKAAITRADIVTRYTTTVKNCRLKDDTFHADSVHLLNKFNYLKIDIPGNTLRIFRVSTDEMQLGNAFPKPRLLKIDSDWDTIMETVEQEMGVTAPPFLRKPVGEFSGINHNAFTDSIMTYITDTIASRLKVVGVLEAARSVQETLEWEVMDYDNDYDPY